MTSFLRQIVYMLALFTAKRIEEVFVSTTTDKILVMNEFDNGTQWTVQQYYQNQHQNHAINYQQQQQQQQQQIHQPEKLKSQQQFKQQHNNDHQQYQYHQSFHHFRRNLKEVTDNNSDELPLPSDEADERCGGILNGPYGIIQTPKFPNKFDVPITCVWIIDASELSSGPNISIVVYLTQLYVLSGLKFTEYMYYSDDYKVPSHRIFELTEDDVTQIAWIQFTSQYLEIRFTMKSLDGTHLRALDRFLDVYGFNITYEVDTVKSYQCNALQCRFLGHCYAKKDFT